MDFKIPHECEAVWRLFEEICSIPHPSGYEAKLGEWVLRQAQAHHLKAERDSFGNIRIDRPASKGYENAPLTILQAHLDMVPQAEEGEDFNFLLDPIRLQEENGWVRSAARTTLGSDDGIGVAAALALLFDEARRAGPAGRVRGREPLQRSAGIPPVHPSCGVARSGNSRHPHLRQPRKGPSVEKKTGAAPYPGAPS